MNPQLKKGLVVAALHLAMVSSLGAKLLVDRAMRPRVWVRTAPVDPDDPLRGRYVRLRVEGRADRLRRGRRPLPVRLTESKGLLAFTPATAISSHGVSTRDGQRIATLDYLLGVLHPRARAGSLGAGARRRTVGRGHAAQARPAASDSTGGEEGWRPDGARSR